MHTQLIVLKLNGNAFFHIVNPFLDLALRITIRHLQEHKNFIVVHNVRYNGYTYKGLNICMDF